jgi:hypothetical protein
MFAVGMQILAGHPQYVFYTGVAATIYTGIRIIWAKNRLKIAVSCAGIYAGAIGLAAVQLFPGIEVASETIRNIGFSYELVSLFSFPPENLLTWLVPGFFGDMVHFEYWGRWLLWEMCVFISFTGFSLAIYTVVFGKGKQRYFLLATVLIMLVLAFGSHTPLLSLLYDHVPGFDKFRGNSKFTFQATLFLIMLSAMGLDLIIRNRVTRRKTLIAVFFALAVTSVIFAEGIRRSSTTVPDGLWSGIVDTMSHPVAALRFPGFFSDQESVRQAGTFAAKNVTAFAGVCILISIALFLSKFHRNFVLLLLLIAITELFVFAWISKATFEFAETPRKHFDFSSAKGPDYRVVNRYDPNSAMSVGGYDIWGRDPGILRRYAEFMAFTQGKKPYSVTQELQVVRSHRLYDMLRCRYRFIRQGGQIRLQELSRDVMPRFTLVTDWRVIARRDRIFAFMNDSAFDPRHTVVLEQDPMLQQAEKRTQKGTVTLVDSSTDHLTIKADVPEAAILLITDAYSEGWRAYSLNGSVQETYNVMPANYCLQAVPLAAGHHHFRLEYFSIGFLVGKWVSIVGLCIYLVAIVWFWWRDCRAHMTI